MTNKKNWYTKVSQSFLNLFHGRIFHGRMKRRSFVLPFLLFFIFPYIYMFPLPHIDPILWVSCIYALFCLPITIKRVRDIGLSGWFAVLSGIPLFNILFALFLLLYPGTKGVNVYGDVPKVSLRSEIVRNILLILYFVVLFFPTAFLVIVYEYGYRNPVDIGVEPHPLWNLPRDHPQYDPRYDPQCLNTYDPEYDPNDEFCAPLHQ